MTLRRPLDLLSSTLGWLCWPVGYFGFGGFDDGAGRLIIGIGSLLLLTSLGAELLLRFLAPRWRRFLSVSDDGPSAGA